MVIAEFGDRYEACMEHILGFFHNLMHTQAGVRRF